MGLSENGAYRNTPMAILMGKMTMDIDGPLDLRQPSFREPLCSCNLHVLGPTRDSLVPNDRHVVPTGSKDPSDPDLQWPAGLTGFHQYQCPVTWITWHYWRTQEQNKRWTVFVGISPAAAKILRLVVLCLKSRPHLNDLRIANIGHMVGFKGWPHAKARHVVGGLH